MGMAKKRKIIVGITGASGSIYARLVCERLAECGQVDEIAVIVTKNGNDVMRYEDRADWLCPECEPSTSGNEPPSCENKPPAPESKPPYSEKFTVYDNEDLFAAPASGSAPFDSMVVVPCSMGTLGCIAGGISNDLLTRAADVMLKERRRLILVTREAPLGTIHLRNMTALSECGAVICPASPSFYSRPDSVEALCNTIVERVVSLLGLEMPHYTWGGENIPV